VSSEANGQSAPARATPPTPSRIHIVGGPGSGKTTLARTLASCLDVPNYSLDTIAFEGREFKLRPLEMRLHEIHQIASSPGWVTEGMWLGWTDELFRTADAIVWLDHVPTYVAGWRMVTRFVRGGLQEVGRQPWSRKFTRIHDFSRNLRLFVCAFQSGMRFYRISSSTVAPHSESRAITRAETARDLLAHKARVIHCRRERDIASFLQSIDDSREAEAPSHSMAAQGRSGE
jgi:adenylate kinase family enzyme